MQVTPASAFINSAKLWYKIAIPTGLAGGESGGSAPGGETPGRDAQSHALSQAGAGAGWMFQNPGAGDFLIWNPNYLSANGLHDAMGRRGPPQPIHAPSNLR